MRLVLLGGPGAGKGTQATKLREHYDIPHISTGEVLREARAQGTELGRKAAEYLDAGKLLPDDIILGIIREKMNTLQRGFLFDGFPRTIPQAEGLDRMLGERGEALDAVVSIEVPDELVVDRLLKRAEIEGRADDNRETIKHRLAVYYSQTEPLKEYYRNRRLLRPVNGVGAVDAVFARITEALSDQV
jgi:adenylate kinase